MNSILNCISNIMLTDEEFEKIAIGGNFFDFNGCDDDDGICDMTDWCHCDHFDGCDDGNYW